VGGEIVSYYWRINPDQEWRPTSTCRGSFVDFGHFPEKWKGWILEAYSRLNVATIAFDMAWQNDALDTEPYIIEGSPSYQPNPITRSKKSLVRYGAWKDGFSFLNGYDVAFVEQYLRILTKVAFEYLKQYRKHNIPNSCE
jgi:hypothetical protein